MPLKNFDKVKLAVENQGQVANAPLRAIWLKWLAVIQIETPRDEGRAANNWFLKTGSPAKNTTQSAGNKNRLGRMPKNVLGKKVYYSNNLPYINRLEFDGHSKQKPRGWVRRALVKMRLDIRKASK